MRAERMAAVLAEHVYEPEFLGGLNEVWTTCICGEHIDATFGDGRSSAEVFRANWSAHVAAALLAAGFGDVAQAKAEALREAADDLEGRLGTEGAPKSLWEFRAWLRARADRLGGAS